MLCSRECRKSPLTRKKVSFYIWWTYFWEPISVLWTFGPWSLDNPTLTSICKKIWGQKMSIWERLSTLFLCVADWNLNMTIFASTKGLSFSSRLSADLLPKNSANPLPFSPTKCKKPTKSAKKVWLLVFTEPPTLRPSVAKTFWGSRANASPLSSLNWSPFWSSSRPTTIGASQIFLVC